MTLQQLAYVREVVRQRFSVSRAAIALRLTQPGLSRQILSFERELGVDVFVRHHNRLVRLSPAGTAIYDLACEILLRAEAIRRAGRDAREPESGTLVIATTHTQARYALPRIIQRFAQRFPSVSLRLRQGTPSDAARMVSDGTADMSIATAPIDPIPGLMFLACHELPRVVLMPARHSLARTGKLTLKKLAEHPLITYDYEFISTSNVLSAFSQHGLSPSVVLNAIDADVIKTYVELGMGIAIVPSIAFDAKRDKQLRALPAGHLFPPNVIQIGIRTGDYLAGFAYEFIEMFAPHLKRPMLMAAMARPVKQP